jgi:prolyl oligopeptidase
MRGYLVKKFLLLSICASALMACQPAQETQSAAKSTPDKHAATSTVETAYQLNKENPMQYTKAGQTDADHLWLEEVTGEKALAKVKSWNEASAPLMQTEVYKAMKAELLEVYNSPEKIPYVSYRAGKAYNFWQDDKHVKGIWRSTTLDSYGSNNPEWDTVMDVDAVAAAAGKNWVFKGADCLAPDYTRCIVSLSVGGKDATERFEYDITTKSFVEDGFVLAESKGGTNWVDQDHLLVGVDFGEGTMTDSGYPQITKLWTRGTPLSEARELYRGEQADVGTFSGTVENADGDNEILIVRAPTFYDTEYYWVPRTGDKAWTTVKLPVPTKTNMGGQFKGQQLVTLQEDWDREDGTSFKSGALVSFSIQDFMDTGKIDTVHEVIMPTARQSIGSTGVTKSAVLLSLYENVSGSAYAFDFHKGEWSKTKLDLPENGNVSIGNTNSKEDIAFINTESFLTPDTLWTIDTKTMKINATKSLPSWFDSSTMVAEQFEVASTDGEKIPYYVVHQKDMKLDGTNPTMLYGYGGFQISINPRYDATLGRAWLARGGVYVSANIRGGGEFGPDWHQAGLKTKRQIIYDDFIAVAEDLIDRKITTPKHLGIHGRSNGGLLMGVMFTQRPDLFNAVVCGVPLLDMRRFHKLLAGASWMGEYGNPEDEGAEGAYIRGLSPYHNIRDDVEYPEMYIYTSTKDDRVHPGHARKMAQRLEDMGIPFLYYENIDGGHAGAANLEETAHSYALNYSYLAAKLMNED